MHDPYLDAIREREDAMFYESMSTSQLMSTTASSYHAQGLDCPWDCSRCPGNVAADLAEQEWLASLPSLVHPRRRSYFQGRVVYDPAAPNPMDPNPIDYLDPPF